MTTTVPYDYAVRSNDWKEIAYVGVIGSPELTITEKARNGAEMVRLLYAKYGLVETNKRNLFRKPE